MFMRFIFFLTLFMCGLAFGFLGFIFGEINASKIYYDKQDCYYVMLPEPRTVLPALVIQIDEKIDLLACTKKPPEGGS